MKPPAEVPAPGDGWVSRKVRLASDAGPRYVAALCKGNVAVHREVVERRLWAVTAITVGYLVTLVKTEEDALRIGDVLAARCKGALGQRTVHKMRDAFPQWAIDWVQGCRLRGTYLDSAPFEEDVG